MLVECYTKETIHSLKWPSTEEAEQVRNYLLPMILEGTGHFIENVETELALLKINDQLIPMTINDKEYQNSYVCSPFSYYINYAKDSLKVIENRPLRRFVKSLFTAISPLFKWTKFNRVIIVNNWLLSTNLFPKMDEVMVSAITKFLQERFPTHAILFRSIDEKTTADQYIALKNNAYSFVSSRQIYFIETEDEALFSSRIFKTDLKRLKNSGYEVVDAEEIGEQELQRLVDLYHAVYIRHYSKLNPQLNVRYFELAKQRKVIGLKALKKDGQIDAVTGFFCTNGVMTCSLLGYDKEKGKEIPLYQMLMTITLEEARRRKLLYHQSAGGSAYKKNRKAEGSIEYMALYDHHLPFWRKAPWRLIKSIYNRVGPHFMKKY